MIDHGANAGMTDWDDPASWLQDDAVAALERLCRDGHADVPLYEIARNGRCGSRRLELGEARLFVAEGIFAPEVVGPCADRGLLAAAYCLRQHRLVTFWRRLTRDLREHRKPPLVLLRRGWTLLREQDAVVAHAVAQGCRAMTPEAAYRDILRLREHESVDD
ncbi:MAG: ATP-binding protein [Nocardioides sp.]